MKKKNLATKISIVTLASCISLSGAVWATETTESATTPAVANEEKIEENNEISLEVVNKTGLDISYIGVTAFDESFDKNADIINLQQALIDQGYLDDVADGSYGPKSQAAVKAFREAKNLSADGGIDEEMLTLLYGTYDDGNLLDKDQLLKPEEQFTITIVKEEKGESRERATDDYLTLKGLLDAANCSTEYFLIIEAGDEEYILHVLPTEDVEQLTICNDGEVVYLEYTTKDKTEASTYEIEKAIYDAEHPVSYYSDYSDYGNYYDDYDYDDYYYDDPYAGDPADGCIEDGLFY